MRPLSLWLCTLMLLTGLPWPRGADAREIHKCTVDGSIVYQQDPCPSADPPRHPTVQELNAARARQARASDSPSGTKAAEAGQAPPVAGRPAATEASEPPGRRVNGRSVPRSAAPPLSRYRCDGRTHCSQMRSCDEAKFFLAHCPGVEMDGDRNGIPCERQWCKWR